MTLRLAPTQAVHSGLRGTLRLIDSPLPRTSGQASFTTEGRVEIGWTLTVQAVTLPGNIPVGGLNVTLTSGHEPDAASATGITGDDGKVLFVALQSISDGMGSRAGNPHVATADDGGKRGATSAMVVEAPMSVTMPVIG
jgi:hypothetical protein